MPNLVERRGALADRLVLVAQQQEVRAGEELGQNFKLGDRVILDLVHHDELRIGGAAAADEQAQVEQLGGRQRLLAQHAHADAVEVEPA